LYESRFHEVFACSKVNRDLNEDDLKGLRHLSFKESEGGESIRDAPHLKHMKLCEHNIGTEENPKLASIGDYWDDQTTKEFFVLK